METVAFYSYKGGVGRSNLLANAARFLAASGKGVVALDFDFEAPGLHYKLAEARVNPTPSPPRGVVPYLLATAHAISAPPAIEEHLISLPVPSGAGGWLKLMPAGPAPHQAYWIVLKELGDKLRFGDPSGQSSMALLDLQARIAQELKPDYLLIDARTGITELGGLATTVLADTVVCMFVPNQESLDGTIAVVEAIKAAPRLTGQNRIRIVPVQSRVPHARGVSDEYASVANRLTELIEGKTQGTRNRPAIIPLPHDRAVTDPQLVVDHAPSPQYATFLAQVFAIIFPAVTASPNLMSEILKTTRWD